MSTSSPELSALPTTDSLSVGAQLFIFSVRQWTVVARAKLPLERELEPFYARYSAQDALPILDEMMCHLSVTAFRPIEIKCPCRVDIGVDEFALVQALRSIQSGDTASALGVLDGLLIGRFGTTFIRIAQAYLSTLEAVGLQLTGVRYLSLVPQAQRV